MNPRDKKIAKIVFLCVSPLMFLGLFRLFFLFCYFVFGMILLWIAGVEYNRVILVVATLIAAFFTTATLVILYRLFKRHILEEQSGKGEFL